MLLATESGLLVLHVVLIWFSYSGLLYSKTQEDTSTEVEVGDLIHLRSVQETIASRLIKLGH